jgi:hypothetical protein
VPHKFLTKYGSKINHDFKLGFNANKIEKKIKELINL